MRTLTILTAAGVIALSTAALSPAARAAGCEDALSTFARQYGLTAGMPDRAGERSTGPVTAPATMESQGFSATDKMAATGGVIQPPETGPAAVINPPPTTDRMTTAPAMPPSAGTGAATSAAKPVEIDAARKTQAEAMLMAARNAAQEGKQDQCFERLQQAEKLVKGPSGG